MPTYPTSPVPIRSYEIGHTHKVLVGESEDGYEQRRYIWPKRKRRFVVSYELLTQTEMQTLVDFYNNTASGTFNTFSYADPIHSETVTCRFVNESLNITNTFFRKYDTQLELIEVF